MRWRLIPGRSPVLRVPCKSRGAGYEGATGELKQGSSLAIQRCGRISARGGVAWSRGGMMEPPRGAADHHAAVIRDRSTGADHYRNFACRIAETHPALATGPARPSSPHDQTNRTGNFGGYGFSLPTTHMAKNWLAPPNAWARARRAPSTCRSLAWPRTCSAASAKRRVPEAPIGLEESTPPGCLHWELTSGRYRLDRSSRPFLCRDASHMEALRRGCPAKRVWRAANARHGSCKQDRSTDHQQEE